MINLLPDGHKREIRAGRANVLLVRYITILSSAVVLLGGLVGGSYVVLNSTRENAVVKVSENQGQVSKYATISSRADSFRNDLTTAKTIFDKEVTYSKLIYKIANVVPKNVVLESLSLDPQKLGSSAVMNASAKTYTDAVELKDTFTNNTALFTDVRFDTISDSGSDSGDAYPIKVNLSVIIQKGALQ